MSLLWSHSCGGTNGPLEKLRITSKSSAGLLLSLKSNRSGHIPAYIHFEFCLVLLHAITEIVVSG